MYGEMMAVDCKNYKKLTNKICGKSGGILNVQPGDTNSNS
jgi:translation initiation factor IF-1